MRESVYNLVKQIIDDETKTGDLNDLIKIRNYLNSILNEDGFDNEELIDKIDILTLPIIEAIPNCNLEKGLSQFVLKKYRRADSYVFDLITLSEYELHGIRGIGIKTLSAIEEEIVANNLKLGTIITEHDKQKLLEYARKEKQK